jgi:hypothetical protein
LSKKFVEKIVKKFVKTNRQKNRQNICQKNLSEKCEKKNCKKNCQTSRNQHQVTTSNTKVTNGLDGEEKKRPVISVLRSSARPASGRRA